jgi:hypothetical protein
MKNHCCGGVVGLVGFAGLAGAGDPENPPVPVPGAAGAFPAPGVVPPNTEALPAFAPSPVEPPPNKAPFAYNCSIRGS